MSIDNDSRFRSEIKENKYFITDVFLVAQDSYRMFSIVDLASDMTALLFVTLSVREDSATNKKASQRQPS